MKRIASMAAAIAVSLTLGACGTGEALSTADMRPIPEIQTEDGLVIDGERIADKQLYDSALEESVSMVSGMGYESEELTAQRFTEETGIEIEFTRMPSNKLLERVLSEAGAGRVSVDVIRTTDMKAADTLADEGVLASYETPFHQQLVDDGVVFADGKFVSSFYSLYAFAFNSKLIQNDVPQTWEDLDRQELVERIGLVQVGAGSYNLALMDFLINEFGGEYLYELGKLEPRIYDSASVQIEALTRGEIAASTLGLNNGVALARAGAPVQMVIPERGSSGAFTPLGLTTRGLENPAAKVFMNWQMSKAGQAFGGDQGFVPSRTDLKPQSVMGQKLPAPDDASFHVFTTEDMTERKASVTETWRDAFGYVG